MGIGNNVILAIIVDIGKQIKQKGRKIGVTNIMECFRVHDSKYIYKLF